MREKYNNETEKCIESRAHIKSMAYYQTFASRSYFPHISITPNVPLNASRIQFNRCFHRSIGISFSHTLILLFTTMRVKYQAANTFAVESRKCSTTVYFVILAIQNVIAPNIRLKHKQINIFISHFENCSNQHKTVEDYPDQIYFENITNVDKSF